MFDNIPKHLPSIPNRTGVLVEVDHFHVKQLQSFLALNQKNYRKIFEDKYLPFTHLLLKALLRDLCT